MKKYSNKILVEDQGVLSALILYGKNEPEYIICIPKTFRKALYVKIAKIGSISSLDCNMLFYEPSGFYVFAQSIDELINKILAKIKDLK